MKIRFMCTEHECDLSRDGDMLITPELLSDNDETIKLGSIENKETGYYLFDTSLMWCPEQMRCKTGMCVDKDNCSDHSSYYKVVLYI